MFLELNQEKKEVLKIIFLQEDLFLGGQLAPL
jgi:hypothetical protein